MVVDPELRLHTDRLARLLGDARGTEILAELQKLLLPRRPASHAGHAADGGESPAIGVWRIEPGPDGVALRRPDGAGHPPGWADVGYVPPAGAARRVVLLGESAARGWPYDPDFGCGLVLARNLAAARPGGYQCVDLARTGAVTADLHALAARLPAVAPDVVVSFVGNNWTLGPSAEQASVSDPEQLELRDALARALRERGYAGMPEVLTATIMERATWFLDRLVELQDGHGCEIVVVIPEFNLRGWTPPPDVETPVLSPAALARWYELYAEAERARRQGRWTEVASIAGQMRELDGGASPVPGYLAGRAALAGGDGAAARIGFEDSRDAVCGLFVRYVPRITRPVQQLLASYAARHGWRCVDLRTVLASTDVPELPDERFFHDYCHLSDQGIEQAMAAVTDAVLGLAPGTTPAGPGVPRPAKAFAHAHAASHLAYTGQPAEAVCGRLRAAVDSAPELAGALAALRDLLSAPHPRWTHPATEQLAAVPGVRDFLLTLAATRGLSPWLWTLRACLAEVVGPEITGDCTPELNLLLGPAGERQPLPSWRPARPHHVAAARWSSLAFPLRRLGGATLALTYRMPSFAAPETTAPAAADVLLNGAPVGDLPVRPQWTDVTLRLPPTATQRGVNRIQIRWPVPSLDPHAASAADAAALARGEAPSVLPTFGEVYAARVRPDRP